MRATRVVPWLSSLLVLLGPVCAAAAQGDPDLSVARLEGLVSLGRVGSFPGGSSGLSLSPTLCNLGSGAAPWLAAMDEAHPGTALSMYRLSVEPDGVQRLRQIGLSWVHHGILPLAQNLCGGCAGGFDPAALAAGCSNTISAPVHGDRMWLGPRREWHAHAGTWACLGSYFDGQPVDCERDESGAGLDAVAHRLAVADADLLVGGSSFFVEALVLGSGDVLAANDLAHRSCVPVWTGASWSFQLPAVDGPAVPGPALQRWGDLVASADAGPADGRVLLAVAVRPLGPQAWRYEYALFNQSLEGRLSGLSLPLPPGSHAPFFADVDQQPDNDWVFGQAAPLSGWSLPPGSDGSGEPGGGPLEFGVLYNFGFTSARPPVEGVAELQIFEPLEPGASTLAVDTLVPRPLPQGVGLRPHAHGVAPVPTTPTTAP